MNSIPITFVLGQSGAGISTALNVYQDCGFLAMDNFPIHLISQLFDDEIKLRSQQCRGFAFGLHSHPTIHIHHLQQIITTLPTYLNVDVIFLTCAPAVLEQRFLVSRRPHPFLAKATSLEAAISLESSSLEAFKQLAHQIIDTTHLSPVLLARAINERLGGITTPMLLLLSSFGFKHHLNLAGDYVFDVRFLTNPYFDPQLRSLNGLHPQIQQYVQADSNYTPLLEHIKALLSYIIPLCQAENRSYLRIAVGCTGGIHRSVTVTEDLRAYFESPDSAHTGILVHTHHTALNQGDTELPRPKPTIA